MKILTILSFLFFGLSVSAQGQIHHFSVDAEGGIPIPSQIAGVPFFIEILAQDSVNNTVTSFSGTVEIASNGMLLLGAGTSENFINGELHSREIKFSNTGSFQLTATQTSGTESGTSNSFNVSPGAAATLRLESSPLGAGSLIPSQSLIAGDSIILYSVTRDTLGNFVENISADAWSLSENSVFILATDLIAANNRKSASFTAHGVGTTKVLATSGMLVPFPSGTISVLSGSPGKIGFSQQPTDGIAGAVLAPPITIQLQDDFGNDVHQDNDTVRMFLPALQGSLSGTTTALTDTNGAATFSDLRINQTGIKTLIATHTGFLPDTSIAFTLTGYTISASSGPHGTVSPSGIIEIISGGNQSFTLHPDTGYHVDSVIVDGSYAGTPTSYSFTNVTTNHTIRATFRINTYTITASARPNGSISPAGAVSIDYGGNQTFTITPNTGYHIDSIIIDGSYAGTMTSYPFTNVTANHTISATFRINTYTITASAGSNGAISPSGTVNLSFGGSQTFIITPNTGYQVDSLKIDGAPVAADTIYTFSSVSTDHTISATFAPNVLTITLHTLPDSLTIIVDGTTYTSPHTFNWNAATSHVISTDSIQSGITGIRYRWNTWSDAGNRTHIITPLVNTTYTTTFKKQCYLTMNANTGGSVTPSSGWYDSATVVTMTAIPDSSYSFNVWSGTGYSGYSNPVSLTINAPYSETASFKRNPVQITIQTSPPGRTFTYDGSTYTTTQTFPVDPGAEHLIGVVTTQPVSSTLQYVLRNWSDGGMYSHYITPTTDSTYTAFFKTQFFVNIVAGSGGTVTPTSAFSDSAATLTLTATPNTGYHFITWHGSGTGSYTGTNNPTIITIAGAINDTAIFAIDTLLITSSAGLHGSISPSGIVQAPYNSNRTFTMLPDSGYHVDSIIVDNMYAGNSTSYTFSSITSSHTIRVVFALTQYSIVATAGLNGTISPNGTLGFSYGQSQTFTISPSTGYRIDSVIVDGTNQGAISSYTFSNISANHTIRAVFATGTLSFTVHTIPDSLLFIADAVTYRSPHTFVWTTASTHTISIIDTQYSGATTRYIWNHWSSGGGKSHNVTLTRDSVITAFFSPQYYLTMNSDTNGTISPSSTWYDSGSVVPISATPKTGYRFTAWSGTGNGSYSGTNNPAGITINAPITETGTFSRYLASVWFHTSPESLRIIVDDTIRTTPHLFSWMTGSTHTIAAADSQNGLTGVRYIWNRWSDNAAISHAVTINRDSTFTASYTTQYYLTMLANTGGTVAPASGWFNNGQQISITAIPDARYQFVNWSGIGNGTGDYSGINNPAQITIDAPISETANFVRQPIQIIIQAIPAGRYFYYDGIAYNTPQARTVTPGDVHFLNVATPQSGTTGIQYVWNNWSDGGSQSHAIMPDSHSTYTATFTTQYALNIGATPSGSGVVTPPSSWRDSGTTVQITAVPNTGYSFVQWLGSGTGSYSGTNATASVTMNGPIADTATFIQYGTIVAINSNPPGRVVTIDGIQFITPHQFNWIQGSAHTIATTSLQNGDTLTRYTFNNWSDGGAISHTVIPMKDTTFTANYTTQYYLTMNAGTGGTVIPSSAWNDSGRVIGIIASPTATYNFGAWNGVGSGSYSGTEDSATIIMNGPINETASFTLIPIHVTIKSAITGLSFIVDSTIYDTTQTFIWELGSQHTISTISPQGGTTGIRYVWNNWSDGKSMTHAIIPTRDSTFTVNFRPQYYVTLETDTTTGSISPVSAWQDSGTTINISATPKSGYHFTHWISTAPILPSDTSNPASIVVNAPATISGIFEHYIANVTIKTYPFGLTIRVDSIDYLSPHTFQWMTGSSHSVEVTDTVNGTIGVRYIWNHWSDGAARNHEVLPLNDTTITAIYSTQYFLTMIANQGGTVTPSSTWSDSGQSVTISALADPKYRFIAWNGSNISFGAYTGTSNPTEIIMGGPITEIASFSRDPVQIVIQTNPPGRYFSYDSVLYNTPQIRQVIPGEIHYLNIDSPQDGGTGTQYVWEQWSDGKSQSHTIQPDTESIYTATFTTQFYLSTGTSPSSGGTATPASGWQDSGKVVPINAEPKTGYSFIEWNGTGNGAYTGTNASSSVTMHGPITDTATFSEYGIHVTVTSDPVGRSFIVDGIQYNSTQQFTWIQGTLHTISTNAIQTGDTLTQYLYNQWSDGGTISHTIIPMSDTSYTAIFTTQYYLTMNVTAGGTATPSSGWHDSGRAVNIMATPNPTYHFGGWNGSGIGSYSGTNPAATLTMNSPITETASFALIPIQVTVRSNPDGRTFIVDSVVYLTPQTFIWELGKQHTLNTTTPQAGDTNIRYIWNNWSDGGDISHTIAPASDTTFTVNFSPQYYLTMDADTVAGTVSPVNAWYDSGTSTSITATPKRGYHFTEWQGQGVGSYTGTYNPATITFNAPITEHATFDHYLAQITIHSSPDSMQIIVDDSLYTSPHTFTWMTGSSHTVATPDTQSGIQGHRYIWKNWSDQKSRVHTISVAGDSAFTTYFGRQYYLTMNSNLGGTVTPQSGWVDSGKVVIISAYPDVKYSFSNWAGSGIGSTNSTMNPAIITMNSPITETANFVPTAVQITIQAEPAGRYFIYDGTLYNTTQTRMVTRGDLHYLNIVTPQTIDTNIQYIWSRWSDAGPAYHIILPDSETTYTAYYTPQYSLTGNQFPVEAGSVSPAGRSFYTTGDIVEVRATAAPGYAFSHWSGDTSGSNNPIYISMNRPKKLVANFALTITTTILSVPSGRTVIVDDSLYTAPVVLSWIPSTVHTIEAPAIQSGAIGTQHLWQHWSDSGDIVHLISTRKDTTITATFTTQHYLTMTTGAGGHVTPMSGWHDHGDTVSINAIPDSGYTFIEWSGTGIGAYSGSHDSASIILSGPINETAIFGRILSPPTLLSPSNGSVDIPLSPTLQWNQYTGVTYYTVQVSTDSSFSDNSQLVLDSITGDSASSIQIDSQANYTTYFWRIKAKVGPDITEFSAVWQFRTITATLSITSPTIGWGTNFMYPLYWSSENLSGPVNIKLSTNAGASFISLQADIPNIGATMWTIPDLPAYISNNCKIRIESSRNSLLFAETGIFPISPGTLPASVLMSGVIPFPENSASSTDYRLFSLPGVVDTIHFEEIFSGTHKIDWRAFTDIGTAEDYLMEMTPSSALTTGLGYWVIKKGNLEFATYTMNMPALDTIQATCGIPLHSGWNIIGNPFDKSVSWQAVLDVNGLPPTTQLMTYTRSYSTSSSLDRFMGYYFYNDLDLGILKIPYPFGITSTIVASPDIQWKIQLAYESDINQDTENYIGIAPAAKREKDHLDQYKPPLFMDQGFLYFSRPEWNSPFNRFSTDFRPSLDEGQTWDFEVQNPRKSRGVLRFNGIDQLPSEYEIRLIDQFNSTPIDLRKQSVYHIPRVSPIMPFKIIVGSEEYVEREIRSLMPTTFELTQNFPNPFNSSTSISVKIPREAHIRIEIFNLLGQRVGTLYNGELTVGTHTFNWDGADDNGKGVASGVYFYRMVENGQMIQSKKMIFEK